MKRYFYLFFILAFVLVVCGCATNKTRVAEGAGIGGAVGALAGGIIGYQSGHPIQGAAIGGVIGGGTGAIVGAQIEKPAQDTPAQDTPAKDTLVKDTPAQAPAHLTMQQIVDLTKQGVSGDEIITKINASSSKYFLTADDLDYLEKQGVSQRVIETMQASGK